MKKIFILVAIASMSLCACNKSDIIENKETATFVASFDTNTKTTLNNDRSQSWLGREVVKVLDVTNAFLATPIETSCTFTNVNATKSTKATFVADDPSFEFIEGHNYIVYYAGTYSTTLKREGAFVSIKFKSDFMYNPLGKYGLSDNQIPLISKFKYSGKASVQNILFHNVTNLLVIRVKNNTSESKQVGYITIKQSKTNYTVNMFGGALIPYTNTDDYSLPGTSYDFGGGSTASGLGQITFEKSITIASGETKDFAVFIVRPYTGGENFDLTTQIFDYKGGNKIAEAVKSNLSKTNFVGPGRTLVWSIDITTSKATNALHINPLGNNELAF